MINKLTLDLWTFFRITNQYWFFCFWTSKALKAYGWTSYSMMTVLVFQLQNTFNISI